MSETRIAKDIKITPTTVLIEGEEFPYTLTADAIEVLHYKGGPSVVTLRVFTDQVSAVTHAGERALDITTTTVYTQRTCTDLD